MTDANIESALVDLSGANDSADLITSIVSLEGEPTDENKKIVSSNVEHLESVLAREHVQSYISENSVDVTKFTSAIEAGKLLTS